MALERRSAISGLIPLLPLSTRLSVEAETPSLVLPSRGGRDYDVSADGERLLTPPTPEGGESGAGPWTRVVLNWFEELRTRVPTGK